MPIYLYKAKGNAGKDLSGEVEAPDQKRALQILREKKLFCYLLKEKKESEISQIISQYTKKITLSDLTSFTRQLATMINSGLPITDALNILSEQESKISDIAGKILRDVQGGLNVADALSKYPKVFSPVYVGLVRAGEAAGVLDNIINRLADNLESQKEFKAKIKGAMIYPIVIVIGMLGVMFVMMIFVIPKMMDLYKEFDADLPAATKMLMFVSTFLKNFWWILIFIVFGLIYVWKVLNKNKITKKKIDTFKFKIPIIGKLLKNITMSEFARTLGLLMGVGVSLVEALEITSKIADNVTVEEAIIDVQHQVEKGYSLTDAVLAQEVFPPILSQMIGVGEETGKIDEVLEKVSKYFQAESEQSLKALTSAMEPLIMVVLGVGVGFLVIAVIMPIYNLTSQFK